MSRPQVILEPAHPQVVGSFGRAECLAATALEMATSACDLVEVRLDLLDEPAARPWSHLAGLPILFTARRGDEGGRGDLSASERARQLRGVLAEAALIDIELVSAAEMSDVLAEMKAAGVPWVASWHDFEGRPDSFEKIPAMAEEAAAKGAACFKAAVRLHGAGDLERLVRPLTRPGPLPLSLMGMGPLAPVSRLLCAQHGSVLNYGYVGDAPTAPGQWSAAQLKAGVAALEMLH